MELEDLKRHRSEILSLATKHGAYNVRVFGSVLHGEAKPGSDTDFLVDFEASRSLLDQAELIKDLESVLSTPVHVVEPQALHWVIRDQVLAEAAPL